MSSIGKAIKWMLPDIALDVAASVRAYRQIHGVYPNLLRPKNFNEKVVARSLFDNRPILRQFADKYAVRAFVAERLGESVLPELLWVTQDPEDIPFARFPSAFVVKPTHGAGWVRIVRDRNTLDRAGLVRECKYWLSQNFYQCYRERVYKDIPPRILVEELIDDGSLDTPTDYKFLVFHGKVEAIFVIADRFGNSCGKYFDRDWNMLDVGWVHDSGSTRGQPGHFPKPPHFCEMIEAAETLGREMDFVRVDFYDTPKKYYFGELTTTPSAGQEIFDPPEFNETLGRLW